MKRIDFFAVKTDLLHILSKLEADHSVIYYEGGMLAAPYPAAYKSGKDLPKIGEATGDQHIVCDPFFILKSETKINVATMLMFNGFRRFDIYQSNNPDSIVLIPGGEWREGSLIAGSITTMSDSVISQKLIRCAHTAVKKSFNRVQAYWVGPEAFASWRAGKRLCNAIQSPPEYDLREPIAITAEPSKNSLEGI
jgi:hypothetical protein